MAKKFDPFTYKGLTVKLTQDHTDVISKEVFKAGTVGTVVNTLNQFGKFRHSIKIEGKFLRISVEVDNTEIVY